MLFMQHSEKGGSQDRMEEKRSYHCQYTTTTTPPPPTRTEQEVGGGRTSETQSHSHLCSFTSLPVIRGITSRMQGFKINNVSC